jgi:hypothetical protein
MISLKRSAQQMRHALFPKNKPLQRQSGQMTAPGAKAQKDMPVHVLDSHLGLFSSCTTPSEIKIQCGKECEYMCLKKSLCLSIKPTDRNRGDRRVVFLSEAKSKEHCK